MVRVRQLLGYKCESKVCLCLEIEQGGGLNPEELEA